MRKFICLLGLLVGFSPVFAQKLPAKNAWKNVLRPPRKISPLPAGLRYLPQSVRAAAASHLPAAALPPESSDVLKGLVAQQFQKAVKAPVPTLAQTEKNIRRSLVEMVGNYSNSLVGSGFVVQSESGNLYAVSAYHITGRAGSEMKVRLYTEDGKPIVYSLKVAATGSYGLNAPDVSIIALPKEAAPYVRPLKISKDPLAIRDQLVAWGSPYAHNPFMGEPDDPEFLAFGIEMPQKKYSRLAGLNVDWVQGFKIVMKKPGITEEFNGMCGSPVLNAKGEVVGIYSGHSPELNLVFAVNARKALDWLIGGYEKGKVEPIDVKVFNRTAFKLQPDETIGWVYHLEDDGNLLHKVYLPQYPGAFDLNHLENLFPDVRYGDILEMEIVQHGGVRREVSLRIAP